jgi:hypothetical protein
VLIVVWFGKPVLVRIGFFISNFSKRTKCIMLLCATGGDVVDLEAFDFLEIWLENLRQFLDRILGDR